MFVLGIDIGSASSKAVILKDGKEIYADAVVQSGTGTSGPEKVIGQIFEKSGLNRQDIARTVGTGYGRFSLEIADRQVSEISCHAKGIHYSFPEARTVLDIGGQDVKAIGLTPKGTVEQFYMNDKCAAGTGRFLDVMAHILELKIEEMEKYDELSENPVTVSSTCTVFAESEVISLLSQKKRKEDIIRGIHNSVISRAMGLLYRTSMEETFVMTGGVAKNKGVVRALERELGKKVYVSDKPQINGALGAALFAWEDLNG